MIEIEPLAPDAPAVTKAMATLRRRGGKALAALLPRLDRLFTIALPFAPGLVFAGGQIRHCDDRGAALLFNLAGTGLDLADALTGCLGEAAERLSQCARPGDAAALTLNAVGPLLDPAVAALLPSGEGAAGEVEIVHAVDFATGAPRLLPADWSLRRGCDGPLRLAGTALSTGVAAGPTKADATTRALLELVERDAAALWWVGGQRGRALPLESPALSESLRLLAALRCGCRERQSWLLDITSDLGIPVIAALSVDRDGRGLACGLAARLSLADAARAALLELMQMELALLVALVKRQSGGEQALQPGDQAHLRRAALSADCPLLQPDGVSEPDRHSPGGDEQEALRSVLMRSGIGATLVDFTRADIGVPVIEAVAPALQPLPGAHVTPRLAACLAARGGGARWVGETALL